MRRGCSARAIGVLVVVGVLAVGAAIGWGRLFDGSDFSPEVQRLVPSGEELPPGLGRVIDERPIGAAPLSQVALDSYDGLGAPFGHRDFSFDAKEAGKDSLSITLYEVDRPAEARDLQVNHAPWDRMLYAGDFDPDLYSASEIAERLERQTLAFDSSDPSESWKVVCVDLEQGTRRCGGVTATVAWCDWYAEINVGTPVWRPFDLDRGSHLDDIRLVWADLRERLPCSR